MPSGVCRADGVIVIVARDPDRRIWNWWPGSEDGTYILSMFVITDWQLGFSNIVEATIIANTCLPYCCIALRTSRLVGRAKPPPGSLFDIKCSGTD